MSDYGILSLFTHQTVQWRAHRQGSRDDKGRPAYESPVDLKCRIVVGREAVSDIAAPGIHADCAVMTRGKVKEDDILEYEGVTYKVKSYSHVPWVGGQYIGRFVLADRYAIPLRG